MSAYKYVGVQKTKSKPMNEAASKTQKNECGRADQLRCQYTFPAEPVGNFKLCRQMAFIRLIPEKISSFITDLVRRLQQLGRYKVSTRDWPSISCLLVVKVKKRFVNVFLISNKLHLLPLQNLVRTQKTYLPIQSSIDLSIWQSAKLEWKILYQ